MMRATMRVTIVSVAVLLWIASEPGAVAAAGNADQARSYYIAGEHAYNKGDTLTAVVMWVATLVEKPTSDYTRKRLHDASERMTSEDRQALGHLNHYTSALSKSNLVEAEQELVLAEKYRSGAACVRAARVELVAAKKDSDELASRQRGPVTIVLRGDARPNRELDTWVAPSAYTAPGQREGRGGLAAHTGTAPTQQEAATDAACAEVVARGLIVLERRRQEQEQQRQRQEQAWSQFLGGLVRGPADTGGTHPRAGPKAQSPDDLGFSEFIKAWRQGRSQPSRARRPAR